MPLFKKSKRKFVFDLLKYLDRGVVGLGESNTALSNIVDVAVGADEGVTKNPVRSKSAEIELKSSNSAVAVSKFEVNDVFSRWDVVFHSTNGEDDVWQSSLAAWNIVELIDEVVLSIGSGDNVIDLVLWTSEPGCAGVGDDLLFLVDVEGSNAEAGDWELPVGLGGQGDVVEGRVAVGGINGAIGDQSTAASHGWLDFAVQPSSEHWLRKGAKQVLDWWDNVVNSQGWPSKTHDTVDWLIAENISNIFSQTEDLLFNGKSGELQNISGQVTIARARTVLDGEWSSWLGAEGGGFARVEAVLGVSRFWIANAGLASALDVDDPVV